MQKQRDDQVSKGKKGRDVSEAFLRDRDGKIGKSKGGGSQGERRGLKVACRGRWGGKRSGSVGGWSHILESNPNNPLEAKFMGEARIKKTLHAGNEVDRQLMRCNGRE